MPSTTTAPEVAICAAARGDLVDGVERLRGVELPQLLAVGRRHREQPAVAGALEHHARDRRRRRAERGGAAAADAGAVNTQAVLPSGDLHRAKSGRTHAVVDLPLIGRAAPHDPAAAASA